MTKSNVLDLSFGGIAPPLKNQLEDQGWPFSLDDCSVWQSDIDAINRLRIRDFITENQARKAEQRLFQMIKDHITERLT